MILAAAIVVTADFGLGQRTSYGTGIDAKLGGQVTRDFMADQDAEAAALSKSDQSLLSNRLSDSALGDVVQQIQGQTGGTAPTVTFQPSSITVLRAQDPNDATLLIEVQEDGTKSVTTDNGPNAAPTQQEISFHGDFWLRPNAGHYSIADQRIQTQPSSNLPQVALVAVALLWVGLAFVLYRRTRTPLAPGTGAPAIVSTDLTLPDVLVEPIEEPVPTAKTLIGTFGGLKLIEEGKDWAPALNGRSVMAFVWRRVFLTAVQGHSATVSRDLVARQAHPRVDRETQLRRLRSLLHEGLRELPDPLRNRIVAEPQLLRFALDDCSIDALDLVKLAGETGRLKVLSPTQAGRARRIIQTTHGIFLPEFESVEDLATDHHPTCTELIHETRKQLGDMRDRLIWVLARTYLVGRRPDKAVELLEPAVEGSPSGPDLRELLAEVYRALGREADARALIAG